MSSSYKERKKRHHHDPFQLHNNKKSFVVKKRWYSSSSVALGLSAAFERARTFGLSRATRSWRGTRGTPRDTPSKNSRRYDPCLFVALFRLVAAGFRRRFFVVVVLCRNDASSIDRSTVVVSRYWTPRACGRDHSPVARGTKNGNAGGIVARVARTLSNNTCLLYTSPSPRDRG